MKVKEIIFLVFLSVVFTNEISAKPRKIVFFGDSLTAGYQLSINDAYPALIGKKLDPKKWEIVNASISGDTTLGGRSRLDWILKSQPDIVVLALGANDGLKGVPASTMQRNLDAMVNQIQKSRASVLLIGMRLPTNYGKTYRQQFEHAYQRVAKRYVITYIPFLLEEVALNPELNLSDGLHPNAKGHDVIASKVLEVLKPIMKRREMGQL